MLPAGNLAPVPAEMPWAQAAAFSLATLTAWRMLTTRARLQAGETVLIWGVGGGVAMAALQVAVLLGARAIVTSGSDAKLEVARRHGAAETINHASADVPAEVRRLTGGLGADVVVDSVGRADLAEIAALAAARRRLVICGATTGPIVSLDLRRLFWHQWSVLGSTLGSRREYAEIVRAGASGQAVAGRGPRGSARGEPGRARAAPPGRTDRQTRDRGGLVNELWDRLRAGAQQIGSVIPAMLGATVILLTGYFLARQVQRWADDVLKRLDFNRMAAAGGLDEVVGRTGSRLDPVRALAKLVFWLVMLVVILLASTALGLESINQMFGTMLGFIPTLIAATVIVILGMIVGEFVRGV